MNEYSYRVLHTFTCASYLLSQNVNEMRQFKFLSKKAGTDRATSLNEVTGQPVAVTLSSHIVRGPRPLAPPRGTSSFGVISDQRSTTSTPRQLNPFFDVACRRLLSCTLPMQV